MSVTTSDGGGTASGTVPTGSGAIGQAFSIGTEFFSVNAVGAPANLLDTGSASTARFNTTNGTFVFTGVAALTPVYFYPALPVMGLINYQQDIIDSNQPQLEDVLTIAFDTKYAYQYTANVGWDRLSAEATAGAATWTGSDSQFFWGASWRGVNAYQYTLFVTNYNQLEPNFMRTLTGGVWDNFRPVIQNVDFVHIPMIIGITLDSARILVPFQNYMVALNTWENETSGTAEAPITNLRNYPFRIRWSRAGNAFPTSTAWIQNVAGFGYGLDLPFNQAIVTVEWIKDRLIVFAESSTWELVYTGNKELPFRIQQINTELGAESTFSVVPFDRVAIGVGNVGIHACNGTGVERIDDSIPDAVFQIHNEYNGIERVYGIRDFYSEMIWWTFPDATDQNIQHFPRKVLVYNYKNGTWALNDDSITCFGYFQPQTDITWDSETVTWDDEQTWDSGENQALFKNVIAGNQQGWTFLTDADTPTNAPALQITDITVPTPGSNLIQIISTNHNLLVGDFVYLQGITGTGNLTLLNHMIFKITLAPADANTFIILYPSQSIIIAGVYSGGGTIARVSKINIETKEFNFYMDQARNVSISKIEFQVDATRGGEIQVDYFVSTADNSMLADSRLVTGSGAILGSGVLETFPYPTIPFETSASRLIHPYYLQANGEFIQLQLSFSDAQMTKVFIILDTTGTPTYTGPTFVDFQLHSMQFYARPTNYRGGS
jgi:hypothetical protein